MKKIKIKLDTYNVISEAVYNGVVLGVEQAYKYTDKPTHVTMVDDIEHAVMIALCEVVDFDK